MIGVGILVYALTCLVAARISYTRWQTWDWFDWAGDYNDQMMAVATASIFWPLALVVWGVHRFITGGVKK